MADGILEESKTKVRFLVDTQLPRALSHFLTDKGYSSRHTIDYPKGALLPDLQIKQIAYAEGRIVVTRDSDFRDAFILRGAPPRVLIVALGNCKNKELLRAFDLNIE